MVLLPLVLQADLLPREVLLCAHPGGVYAVQYSAVLCSTVLYSVVLYSAVLYSAVLYSEVLNSAVCTVCYKIKVHEQDTVQYKWSSTVL